MDTYAKNLYTNTPALAQQVELAEATRLRIASEVLDELAKGELRPVKKVI